MQANGYLYGSDCRNHQNYLKAKKFLNKFIPDSQLSLNDSCYYLNNYNHIQYRGGHRYARPSYAFKFLIKKNMKYFHKGQMEYCYHGTKTMFLKNIIQQGLKIPDGKNVKTINGSQYGQGIYSTKIPQYAQLYAQPYYFQGKYYQTILLLRQDLNKIKNQGGIDKYGIYTNAIYNQFRYLTQIHLLHQQLMKQTDIQWVTEDQKSIIIEAVIVKVHQQDPKKGEIKKINNLLRQKVLKK